MTLLDRERLVTRTGLRLEVRAARGEDELARQLGDVLGGCVDALETAGLTEDGTYPSA